MSEKRLYDLLELLEIIPCSRAHLYNAANRGEIPTVTIGRRKFVPSWFVDKLLNEPEMDPA